MTSQDKLSQILEARAKEQTQWINKIVAFVKKELKIKSNVTVVEDKKIEVINKEINPAGCAKKIDNNNFKVIIKDFKDKLLVRIIAHELVHVKQFESGRLKLEGDIITFCGEQMSYQNYMINYHDNEPAFETEAYDQSREIESKFYKTNQPK